MRDADRRLRGRKLQQRRQRWFARHPLCVHCQAKTPPVVRLAMELDHVVPLFRGGRDDETNFQGLCAACHAIKTAGDLGHAKPQRIGVDGWPVDE